MGVYAPDRPVAGPGRFFGREQLVRSLFQGVQSGRSFAICGGPKTGRSSTLAQLEHLIYERWVREPTASKVVPVPVDLATLANKPERSSLGPLWDALVKAVSNPHVLQGARAPSPPKMRFERVEDLTETFLEAADSIFKPLAGTPGWCRYAFVLDNVDAILTYERLPEVRCLDELMRSKHPHAPQAMVFAGGRMLREQLIERSAPLRSARPMLLGVLRASEAEALVRTGLSELPAESLDTLLATSGRHPFVLQRICAELELQGSDFDVAAAVRNASADIAHLYEAVWEAFDFGRHVSYRGAYAAPEHALMQLVIEHKDGIGLPQAEAALGIRPLREHAELLEYLGVAERRLDRDDPRWSSPSYLWNSWYERRVSY